MTPGFRLFPQAASTNAPSVDGLFLVLVLGSFAVVFLIFLVILVFSIRYRRREGNLVAIGVKESMLTEVTWSVIPLILLMGVFGWGAKIYFDEAVPPGNSSVIYVVGKQWMWKLQHPQGIREINELHVPVHQPVRLVMTSEDVVHSFFIPAFRVKQDVLPGRYTQLWFEATETGRFPLTCAEYCGTNHSRMHGFVYVMSKDDYESWLSGASGAPTMAKAGEEVFHRLGCATCHVKDGPPLQGVYGSRVALSNGTVVVADDRYIRESIIDPTAKIVRGYEPLMPTFSGSVSEEEILQLIAYIRSLANEAPGRLPEGGQGPASEQPQNQNQGGAGE